MSDFPGAFRTIARLALADAHLESFEKQLLGGLTFVLDLPPEQSQAILGEVRAEVEAGHAPEVSAAERREVRRVLLDRLVASGAPEEVAGPLHAQLARLLGKDEAAGPALVQAAGGKLQPLGCSSCGSPVPLADRDHVDCPACGSEVALPAEYRKLRAARSRLSVEQDRGQELLDFLGDAPRPWQRWLAYANPEVHPTYLIAALVFFFPVARFGIYYPSQLAYRFVTGVNAWDGMSGRLVLSIWVCSFFGVFGIPWMLAKYYRVREATRVGLGQSLAAAPPTRPGGPAGCRKCGAPLALEAGALAVVCDYCSTENLVTRAAMEFRHEHQGTHLLADTLAQAHVDLRDRLGKAAFQGLRMFGAFLVVLAFTVFAAAEAYQPGYPGKWSEEVRGQPRKLAAEWSDWGGWGDVWTEPRNAVALPESQVPGSAWTRQEWLAYFVPLRAGETVVVHAEPAEGRPLAPGEVLELEYRAGERRGPWPQGAPSVLEEGSFRAGSPLRFTAPLSGWFRLELRQEELAEGVRLWVRVE